MLWLSFITSVSRWAASSIRDPTKCEICSQLPPMLQNYGVEYFFVQTDFTIKKQHFTSHCTCPPVNVLADRKSSAGPLWVNDEGNSSPVLTFTPVHRHNILDMTHNESIASSQSVVYSSLTYSIYHRPMNSINNNVINFYKNRKQKGEWDEGLTGKMCLHNCKHVRTRLPVMQHVSRWISSFCLWNAAVMWKKKSF